MVSPTSPDMRVTYLDATEHPGTVQEYKIMSTPWGLIFSDPVVATAILDRLLHHSHVITIRGDSYRLKEKRRSGLLQKPAAPDAKLERKS